MNRPKLLAFVLGSAALVAGCTSPDETTPTNAAPQDVPTSSNDGLKAQALALYTSTPFTTTNDRTPRHTPEHSWLETGDGRLTFLHWNHADAAHATGLLFTGEGFRGAYCLGDAGVSREEYDAGFVHFHSAVAPNWDAGHNAAGNDGAPDTQGWWLRHVGAGDMTMTMMGQEMTIQKGKVFPLMPAGIENVQPCA